MAIYMFATTPMSRKKGRSAVAAAAYRSGSQLFDERTGVVHDYCRKRGILHTEIVAPPGITAPDREQLWNAAEEAEKASNSRVAREYLVALPHELDADQRLALTRELATELVERYGVAVDIAIHAPDPGGDERNFHAHLLATTRRINHGELGKKTEIEWSDRDRRKAGLGSGSAEIKYLRQRWETLAHAAMERAGIVARIDCRTLKDQGINRVPQIHVGPMGTEQIRRGTPENSDRAMLNLAIIGTNAEMQELRERLDVEQAFEAWAEITPVTPRPTVLELPEPASSPAADAELSLARESVRLDAHERIEQHIAGRHQLQIRASLRALERTQQRRWERIEEREWQQHISQPGVCPTTGRIDLEARMMYTLEQGWRESQRLEAAERAARRQEPPRTQPQPEAKAAPSSPPAMASLLLQERAAADVRQLLMMRDQGERAAAIRDSMLDTDAHYADAFQEQMIELGIGAHGELSPRAQRGVAQEGQVAQRDPRDAPPGRKSPGSGGPGL